MKQQPRNIFEEHLYLAEILNEVKQRTGVAARLPLLPVNDGDPYTVGVNGGMGVMIYVPGISRLLTKDQLGGVFAHEIGHVKLHFGSGLSPAPSHELEADDFAKEHGYGEALASALSSITGTREEITEENSVTHPPDRERIQRLRADTSSKNPGDVWTRDWFANFY